MVKQKTKSFYLRNGKGTCNKQRCRYFPSIFGKWCKIRMKIRSNNNLSLSIKLFHKIRLIIAYHILIKLYIIEKVSSFYISSSATCRLEAMNPGVFSVLWHIHIFNIFIEQKICFFLVFFVCFWAHIADCFTNKLNPPFIVWPYYEYDLIF